MRSIVRISQSINNLQKVVNRRDLLTLYSKRRRSSDDSKDPVPRTDPGWVTINLGPEIDTKELDMNDRIKDAERWVSKKLSDEDSKLLNKALGIDAEILAAMAEEDDDIEDIVPKKKKGDNKNKDKENNYRLSKLRDLSLADSIEARKIRGFLELNPYICSGCGTPFQSKLDDNPGYLPKEKFQEHRLKAELIRDKQEAVKILEMAGIELNSDAAEDILKSAGVSPVVIAGVRALGYDTDYSGSQKLDYSGEISEVISSEEISGDNNNQDLFEVVVPKDLESFDLLQDKQNTPTMKEVKESSLADNVCICQRCYRLQQYGQVEESLRPGWSSHELLTPERFESLLNTIKENDAVVLCIIDLFDLHGSVLKNLKAIAGSNPIVIAANKIDLFPKDVSNVRITNWIHNEVKTICGLKSPREVDNESFLSGVNNNNKKSDKSSEDGVLRRANIHLVSCQSGFGMDKLMESLFIMAKDNGNKVYVMGAANVGKSSFINRLLDLKQKNNNNNRNVPQATVSNLPGTTLDFLKIKLPNGITMIDTPGLINKGQLTSKLTPSELKQIIPTKPINTVTLRVQEQKCVLIGGLAIIELLEGRPFFFTFFISNEVKLHPTDSARAHVGTLISPPSSYERLQQLQPFDSHEYDIQGEGWDKSSVDIVIAGLGWISITGSGVAKVKVTVPNNTSVDVRPSLLPFEAKHSTASFTGGRLSKKSKKTNGGKSYGWRA